MNDVVPFDIEQNFYLELPAISGATIFAVLGDALGQVRGHADDIIPSGLLATI